MRQQRRSYGENGENIHAEVEFQHFARRFDQNWKRRNRDRDQKNRTYRLLVMEEKQSTQIR